jgi:MOSC domain-containing protein YiiM
MTVSATRTIELVAVSVAEPAVIGHLANGKPVHSGIRKQRVTTGTIAVGKTNLAGDRQADLTVHGGVDKAIYAYPSEHLPVWTAELGFNEPLGPNAFGENLTTRGIVETEICIGDVYKWGTALIQVSQPRGPCYKLEMALGLPAFIEMFVLSGRSGWYLRVLQEGQAPVAGAMELIERHPVGLTVWEAIHARMIRTDPTLIEKALSVPELAHMWSKGLKKTA